MKTVGVRSPGASQRAAGREAVPPRSGGTELATDASSALSTKRRELFYRSAHCFSFSWNSLICTRLHSLGICAGSSEPWEESREGRAWDICETTMPWYPPPPQTLWDTSHQDSCQMVADLNQFHQRVEQGIYLINFSMHLAVDIPSLNHSFCSQKQQHAVTVYFSWNKVLSTSWQGKQRVLSSPMTYVPIETWFRMWRACTYFSPQNSIWKICYQYFARVWWRKPLIILGFIKGRNEKKRRYFSNENVTQTTVCLHCHCWSPCDRQQDYFW